MPRDYKYINRPGPDESFLSNLLTFSTGLAIGLFIAFLVYLYGDQLSELPFMPEKPQKETKKIAATPPQKQKEQEKEEDLPEPKFDFYKILPNKKVNISEWIAEMKDNEKPAADETTLYVFQVGSFKDYKSADQVKAKLALLGIRANIQRTVINGQDTVHRVRIGPFKDQKQLKATREKLMANNLDFLPLKLNIEDLPNNGE